MPLLFCYGTLQEDRVQLAVFGRLVQSERDCLAGYELSHVQIENDHISSATTIAGSQHYANLKFTERTTAQVNGLALDVSDAELEAADAYEKEVGYERIPVRLSSGRLAWVYVHGRTRW